VRISSIPMVCLLAGAAPAAHAQTAVEPGKMFVGPEGLTVAVVPLKPRADNKVLVQVMGSGTVFDGKAILHTVEGAGSNRADYQTTYHGREWHTLVVRDGVYSLHVPGRRDGAKVSFDEKRTAALKSDDVHAAYKRQDADGSLKALAAFDRKAESAQQEKKLDDTLASFAKACGGKPSLTVEWTTFSDADIRELSITSYCGDPLDRMRQMCESSNEAKQAIATNVKTFVCTMGKAMQLDLAGTTLTWTTSRAAVNMSDFARQNLEKKFAQAALPAGGGSAGGKRAGETPPWGKAETLGERMILEKTGVCTDGKSHYVVVAPSEKQSTQLYYGDGKVFHRVPLPPWVLSGDSFFEPRFMAKGKNPNFRGLDMRMYASASYDGGKQACSVSCGERKATLSILDDAAKKTLLGKATFEPPLHKRAAHHLARDDNGRYFYVDKGNTPETEKNFRLFVGPKGGMKLQKMTNAVADTEGEIFTTKTGSLRYVTDRKNPPVWTQGGKKTILTVVPIESVDANNEPTNNYQLIYNELGVYLGEKLGNPCDDL
jgi:hypothetical protein